MLAWSLQTLHNWIEHIQAAFLPIMERGFTAALNGWNGWPFTGYGYEGGIWPSVARFALVAVLLVGIALFLRLLFGPKGPLRGQGWHTIEEARKKKDLDTETSVKKTPSVPPEK